MMNNISSRLWIACEEGNLTRVKQIVADSTIDVVNSRCPHDKSTLLMMASFHGYFDIVKFLIEKGAVYDVQNNEGDTALTLASFGGHESIVRLLLHCGARADIETKDGSSALSIARRNGYQNIAALILRSLFAISSSADIAPSRSRVGEPVSSPQSYKSAVASRNYLSQNSGVKSSVHRDSIEEDKRLRAQRREQQIIANEIAQKEQEEKDFELALKLSSDLSKEADRIDHNKPQLNNAEVTPKEVFCSHDDALSNIKYQLESFKKLWNEYRYNTLGLRINRDPRAFGYRTVIIRRPRDGRGDAAYLKDKQLAEIWKVRGDGNCGFNAVGVSRENFVREVFGRWDHDPDIRQAMKNDFKGFLVEWSAIRPEEDRRYFSEQLKLLITNNYSRAFDDTDSIPDADTKAFIEAYYIEKGDFPSAETRDLKAGDGFITSCQDQAAGDNNAQAVWRPESGALKALARIRGVNLYVWKAMDDSTAPEKFRRKRQVEFKLLHSPSELDGDFSVFDAEEQKQQWLAEFNQLVEEIDLSAYPWSCVQDASSETVMHILNTGNHYDIILPRDDIEAFPHAFMNEVISSKASSPEWSDDIDRTVNEFLILYPKVRQLLNAYSVRDKKICDEQKQESSVLISSPKEAVDDLSDVLNSQELNDFKSILIEVYLLKNTFERSVLVAWKNANYTHKKETQEAFERLKRYAKLYMTEMGIDIGDDDKS